MGFKDVPDHQQGIALLQRSLERGRLAHAYLFAGEHLGLLESLARALAKTLNCTSPITSGGVRSDSCDECLSCRKIDHDNHPDVHWLRPESKMRIITVDQVRTLTRDIQLKPNEGRHKVAILVAADRLKTEAANAFLKTLEEPPSNSVFILLSTDPQRLLETILSRCLRLSFGGQGNSPVPAAELEWLVSFSQVAAAGQTSLISRYRLLDVLLQKLGGAKASIEAELSARSPLEQYKDAEKETVEQWEAELAAAVEAEYRKQRADLIGVLHRWLRDIWLLTLDPAGLEANSSSEVKGSPSPLLHFPEIQSSARIAQRLSTDDALANLENVEQLQIRLGTNVQEALALEVGLLKLKL